jgi:hypothetical protein
MPPATDVMAVSFPRRASRGERPDVTGKPPLLTGNGADLTARERKVLDPLAEGAVR